MNELDTGNDFGSYKYMLKTNDIINSQIKAHNDINPRYRVKMLKGLLRDFVPKKILDIGCGLGFTTNELKKSYPNAQLTGIDISTDAILFAKENFACCSFLAEPIDPNNEDRVHKADLICAFEFYPFTRTPKIKDHRKYLDHLLGWLNEGGKLIIFQRWDNEESLSINFETLNNEFCDYKFQSYCMPIRKIAFIIPNRNVSLFLSQILRAILQKFTGRKIGENRAIIIKKA